MTNCRLLANGKSYGGFKNLSIKQSVEAISSVFAFEFSDMWDPSQEPWPLNTQDLVTVELYGKPVISGYIDVLRGDLQPDGLSYTVEGRDKTSDLIDCSVAPKTYTSIDLLSLCKDLVKKFPIEFSMGTGVKASTKVTGLIAEAGETVFEVLDKVSSKTGCLFVVDGKGGLVITQRGSQKASVRLIEGVNAKNFSFQKDYSERYSDYIVQGTNSKATSVEKTAAWFAPPPGSLKATKSVPKSEVRDAGIKRYRPLYVKQSGNSNQSTTKAKAEWEANVRAAKSLSISCTVQSWKQSDGRIWRINELVQVEAPRLGIGNAYGDEYLIATVEYSLTDGGGEETFMTLLPKEAFLPEVRVDKKKRDEKGARWFDEKSKDVQVYPGVSKGGKK